VSGRGCLMGVKGRVKGGRFMEIIPYFRDTRFEKLGFP
jgi:hypothetical protein